MAPPLSPTSLLLPPACCAKHLCISAIVPGPTFLRAASWHARRAPVTLLRLSVALARVPDLLVRAKHLLKCAKHLLERANRTGDRAKFARQRDQPCRAWRSRRPLDASGQILEPSGFLLLDISGTPNLMRAGYPLDRVPGGWTGSHPRTSRGRASVPRSGIISVR